MDRDRYRKRVHELHSCAQLVNDLTRVPDRATEKDLRQASDLMTGAATDINDLIKTQPPGCICQRVENDNYNYLDYAEGCLHHRDLYRTREALKANYEKRERALKDEVRLRLVEMTLSGTAMSPDMDDGTNRAIVVKRAIAIADEALRQITEAAT
jgi:hypothetical protein